MLYHGLIMDYAYFRKYRIRHMLDNIEFGLHSFRWIRSTDFAQARKVQVR